jgi:hypothetical protein
VTVDDKEAFLARWSRLKREQAAPAPDPAKPAAAAPAPALPPVEKLTPESDFSGFMHPKVEDALRRAALKKLFGDPHFNVPDPYEAYSGDWTGGGAIPAAMLKDLYQNRRLFTEDKPQPEKPATETALDKEEIDAPEAAPAPAAEEQDEPGRQDA